jgi:hypothetical protein
MTDRRWWLKLLTLMRQQEEKMQELYRTYAQLFPGHAAAWQRLSATEMEHADWVSILQAKLQEGSIPQNRSREFLSFCSLLSAAKEVAIIARPRKRPAEKTGRLRRKDFTLIKLPLIYSKIGRTGVNAKNNLLTYRDKLCFRCNLRRLALCPQALRSNRKNLPLIVSK